MRVSIFCLSMIFSFAAWSAGPSKNSDPECNEMLGGPSQPAEGFLTAPADWARLTSSEVTQNPYSLSKAKTIKVISRRGEEVALSFPLYAYEDVKRLLRQNNDAQTVNAWTQRTEEVLGLHPRKAKSLAKLWANGTILREIAFRDFAQIFDESLWGHETQPGTQLMVVSLSPRVGRLEADSPAKKFAAAAAITATPPKWLTPLDKSKIQKRPGVVIENAPEIVFQNRNEKGVLTVVEGTSENGIKLGIFKNKTFVQFMWDVVRHYKLPVSTLKEPEYIEALYTSRTAKTSRVFNNGYYLLKLIHYSGTGGEERVRIDDVQLMTMEDYLRFYAQDVFDNLQPMISMSGIFVPSSFLRDRTNRVDADYTRKVLADVTPEQRAELMKMPVGEMRLMTQQRRHYEASFHILRLEDGLAIVSLW